MPASLPLGNDVVAWRQDDNALSAGNRRYVERVLAPQEQDAAHDGRVFWAYWAAKEAAYKALKKRDSSIIFSHRRFVVETHGPGGLLASRGCAAGVVDYRSRRIPVRWEWTDEWVHCVTAQAGDATDYRIATLEQCRKLPTFAAQKRASRLHDAGVAVRVLAQALLDECGIHGVQIERAQTGRRQAPPRVVRGGVVLPGVDVSLSHDGHIVAAAVRVRPPSQSHIGER